MSVIHCLLDASLTDWLCGVQFALTWMSFALYLERLYLCEV